MLKICCNVLVMVGLFSCVFGDSEDVVLNKNETSQARPRPAHVDGPTKSSSVQKANTMSIVRKLSKAFRYYSIHQNKAAPQYRWLSEGPNGLSSVPSRVETSKTSTEKDTEKDERRRKLKNQFRLFHSDHKGSDLLFLSPTKGKQESKKHAAVSHHHTDGPHTDAVPDHILVARILRPKSLPPLAPNAKDISLIIRKRNRITKETGYYIFENLESLIKHNKLNEFRLTPIDIHKI